MPLTKYAIAGSLRDALDSGPEARGTVQFIPYGSHDSRVEDNNVLLGSITENIADLDDPYMLDEGSWTVIISTTHRISGWKKAFEPIQVSFTHDSATTWADIVSGVVTDVPVTPTLLQQAEDAQEAAEAAQAATEAAAATVPSNATLQATYARRRFESVNTRAAGVIVFTWDDGYPEWDNALALANTLGQRHTWCVTSDRIGTGSGWSSASILAASQAGHEIAAHSKTHVKINSSLAAATRLTEYETPRTAIEAIIGAGKVRTWVYPFGTASSPAGRDATTDQEIYLRYDRQLDTTGSNAGILPLGGPPRFTVPRVSIDPYSAAACERAKELVRRAASSPIVVPFYSHDFNTGAAWTRIQEIMQLAHDLGVPCVTAAEAFPAAPFTLPDPGFESSTLTWFTSFGNPGAQTIAHATVTPDTNMPGGKALAITTTGSLTDGAHAYMDWQGDGGVAYTLTGRVKNTINATGTTPKAYVRAEFFKYDGTSAGTGSSSGTYNGTSWQRFSHAFTAPAGTESIRIKLIQEMIDGVTYFDHVHLGPTALGTYG